MTTTLTDDQLRKLIVAFLNVDGGCSCCVGGLLRDVVEIVPEWKELAEKGFHAEFGQPLGIDT